MQLVIEAVLIALREGLEAFLVTGLLVGLVAKLGRPDAAKHVWLGFAAAVAASVLGGFLVQRFVLDAFEERGGAEWFELVAALAAVVVLTYMVFWMWKHTRSIMASLRARVAVALSTGALASLAFLTFASVLREGLEVVLFYGALASRAPLADLAVSGLVGFALSALLVALLLAGAWRFDLARFFAATGALLVLVAGGLLVHSVMAATTLGLVPEAPAIWDTSAALPDDSALGRVLHALVGYTSQPTLVQAVLYFAYVLGVGGAYFLGLGLFHRRDAAGARVAPARVLAALVAVALVVAAVGAGAANPTSIVPAHAHAGEEIETLAVPEGETIGVLLRSHGEPVHYNETTYRSFADFAANLLVMLGYGNLLLVDQGTVLLDAERPFEKGFRADAALMDAWTRPFAGPAAYVGSPVPQVRETELPLFDGYYLAPGGPGLGEPDVLEAVGLGAYADWLQMANESPMHRQKALVLDAAEKLLRERYGDRVVIERSYHIVPHVAPGESDAEAAERLVAAGVTLLVDAYTSASFSDAMDTCMMRPHAEHALAQAGYRGKLVHAEPSGPEHDYAHAVAREVARQVERAGEGQTAVFLSHHGARPGAASPCGAGVDAYHANAKRMFDAALAAIGEELPGADVEVFQVYGQGAGEADDGVLSPLEAVEEARAWGADRVLDLPFELTGNGFDNLVAHRASYGLAPEDAPHYDDAFETTLDVGGVPVRILSSAFEADARGAALAAAVEEALAAALGAEPRGHGH